MRTAFQISFLLAISTLIIACAQKGQEDSDTKGSPTLSEEEYLARGREIAGITFTTLSAHLTKALAAGGVQEAVQYCNLAASPLVDSLSKVHHAVIRRTTFKVRNPANSPTAAEQQVLNTYLLASEAGQPLEPFVQAVDSQHMAYYAPIFTNSLCLKCHGIPGETLRPEDYDLIKTLYPEDQATGYAEGDFRGMWSIQFGEF